MKTLAALFASLFVVALLSSCSSTPRDRSEQQIPWNQPAGFQDTPPGMDGFGPGMGRR